MLTSLVTNLVWNLELTTVLAIALALLCRVSWMAKRPGLRHWLWLLLLAKLVMPPLISIPLLPATVSATFDAATPASLLLPTNPRHDGNELRVQSASVSPSGQDYERQLREPTKFTSADHAASSPAMGKSVHEFARSDRQILLLNGFLIVSLIGTVSMLAVQIARAMRLLAWLRRASKYDPVLAESCASVAAKFNIGRTVQTCAVDTRTTPLLCAWHRPLVVVPRQLIDDLSPQQLQSIIAHELAHLVRRDHWANAFVMLVKSLLWWNPVVWWADRELRAAQELCCDALAMDQCQTDRRSYATTLLKALEFIQSEPAAPRALATGMGSRTAILRRFEMIGQPSLSYQLSRWALLGLLVSAFPLVCMPVRGQEEAPSAPAAASGKTQQLSDPQHDKPQGLTYQGKVVDKRSGKPVEGATVLVRKSIYSSTENRVLEETKHLTDAQGVYSFHLTADEVAERYMYLEFEVTYPRYAHRSPEGFGLSLIQQDEKLGEPPFFARLDVQPGEEISGTLVTPDGQPAAGERIDSFSKAKKDDMTDYGSFADTKTDVNGVFRLNVVKGGEAVLWLLPRQYAPSTHLLHQQRGDLGRFVLEKGVTLQGRVVDVAGKPIAGVWVSAELQSGPAKKDIRMPVSDAIARSAVSDPNGQFTLAPLPPGDYTMIIDEHARADDTDDRSRRPVPDIFLHQEVTLNRDQPSQTVEIRAVPHVNIELQQLDSAGKPKKTHAVHFWSRTGDRSFWTDGRPDAHGKIVIKVPKGLDEATINISTNEHGAARYRRSMDGPLMNSDEIKFWKLQKDVRDLMIYYYDAPVVLVKAMGENGAAVTDFKPQIVYRNDKKSSENTPHWFHGIQGDVYFEKQGDGRWRTKSLLPDEPFLLIVEAEGYKPWCDSFKLAEKEVKELEVRLQRK